MTTTTTLGNAFQNFTYTDGDFSALREIITGTAGIDLPDSKKTLVYTRLTKRLRALGLSSFADYIKHVKAELQRKDNTELGEIINAVTTNVTGFFREAHHFDTLTAELPELLAKFGKVRIWSGACSTGEEPWSLAMTVHEFQRLKPSADIKIIATDIDTNAVKRAQDGLFALKPEARDGHPLLKKYLKPHSGERLAWQGPSDTAYAVDDKLRPLVSFKQVNLLQDWGIMERAFHVVFLRNVIIYFSKETQRGLFERIAARMPEGALLCIGHSESLLNVSEAYTGLGRTAYRRLAAT